MHLSLAVRERDQLSSSLVADPLGTENWIATDHVAPGSNARPDAVQVVHAWMDGSTTRLQTKYFARDLIDKNQYTSWIITALVGMVAISVVAGMGFMSTITDIFLGLSPSTAMRMILPPLYLALLAVLTGAFVAILFMVHRARESELHHLGTGFAGFAWNSEGGEQYLGIETDHPRT